MYSVRQLLKVGACLACLRHGRADGSISHEPGNFIREAPCHRTILVSRVLKFSGPDAKTASRRVQAYGVPTDSLCSGCISGILSTRISR